MILTVDEAAKKYNVQKSTIMQRIKKGSLTFYKIYNKKSRLVTGVSELELNEVYHEPIHWYKLSEFCELNNIHSNTFYKYANLQKDKHNYLRQYKNKTYVSPKFAKRLNAICKMNTLDIVVPKD